MPAHDAIVTFTTFFELVKLDLMIRGATFGISAQSLRRGLMSVMLNAGRLYSEDIMDHIPENEEDVAAHDFVNWCLRKAMSSSEWIQLHQVPQNPERPVWLPEEFELKFNL